MIEINREEIDRQFEVVQKKYLEVCSKSFREFVIGKAFFICRAARSETTKAKKEAIEKLPVTVQGTSRKGTSRWYGYVVNKIAKGGRQVAQRQSGKRKFAATGGREAWNAYVGRVSKSIINRRRASVGWAVAGWNTAIAKLRPLAKDKFNLASDVEGVEGKFRGRQTYGDAIIIDAALTPSVTCSNKNCNVKSKSASRAKKIADAGLARGIQIETASMIQYLEERGHANFAAAGIKQA